MLRLCREVQEITCLEIIAHLNERLTLGNPTRHGLVTLPRRELQSAAMRLITGLLRIMVELGAEIQHNTHKRDLSKFSCVVKRFKRHIIIGNKYLVLKTALI